MKVRIKITDSPAAAQLSCKNGTVKIEQTEYLLPESFTISAEKPEKLLYVCRHFHLHYLQEADNILGKLPPSMSAKLGILPVGEIFNGRGLPRYWIISQNWSSNKKAESWRSSLKSEIRPEFDQRETVEGGIYTLYPEQSSVKISLSDPAGEVVFEGTKLTLSAPEGITLHQAPLGETFHWEHTEALTFTGSLEFRSGEKGLLIVNELPLEDYLASVNSSEMSAKAPLEFLQAQTIAARSTVIATIGNHHHGEPFDLCNGDHCQCYYGCGRIDSNSHHAAESTEGQVLTYKGIICDARYAKICGGITEQFNQVWENFNPPYLPVKFDGEGEKPVYENWRDYIEDRPNCWCNPEIYPYPDDFDYARPWFRWKISLSQDKLAEIVKERTGVDLGSVEIFEILKFGESGRIIGLRIIGQKSVEIFGELNIRRTLSASHLPSSCFYPLISEKEVEFHGAGWGHGVGMCQMGALNMALNGFNHREILQHYYPGTELEILKFQR